MIKVTEIPFTGYPVTDLARARGFYENVLGLKTADTWLHDNGTGWIEYDIGAGTLASTNGAPEWKPSSDGPGIALEVEDVEKAWQATTSRGGKSAWSPREEKEARVDRRRSAPPPGRCLRLR